MRATFSPINSALYKCDPKSKRFWIDFILLHWSMHYSWEDDSQLKLNAITFSSAVLLVTVTVQCINTKVEQMRRVVASIKMMVSSLSRALNWKHCTPIYIKTLSPFLGMWKDRTVNNLHNKCESPMTDGNPTVGRTQQLGNGKKEFKKFINKDVHIKYYKLQCRLINKCLPLVPI